MLGLSIIITNQILHVKKRYHTQIIWCNSKIRIDNRPIKWERLMQVGVNRVKDLISQQSCFYTYDDFCVKYGFCITWLDYYSLMFAIPEDWLPALLGNNSFLPYNTPLDKLQQSSGNITRTVYRIILVNQINGLVHVSIGNKSWR